MSTFYVQVMDASGVKSGKKVGQPWWRLCSNNGQIVAQSETYSTVRKCVKTAAKVAMGLNCSLFIRDLAAEELQRARRKRWRATRGDLFHKDWTRPFRY